MDDITCLAVSLLVLGAYFAGVLTARQPIDPIPVARREKRHSRMSVLGLAVGKPNRRRS